MGQQQQMHLPYYVASSCLAFLSIPWVFVELPILLREHKLGVGFRFDFLTFGTNSLCAFTLNLAVFLLVGKTSALTINVARVVKDWLLHMLAFSWSVIKDMVIGLNLFGYGFAVLGVGCYNHLKLQAMKAKESQRKSESSDAGESGN